jgi:ATP-dependent Lhr-like helicase
VDPDEAAALGRIDPEAVARVCAECAPTFRDAEELHETLVLLGCLGAEELASHDGARAWLQELAAQRRASAVTLVSTNVSGNGSTAPETRAFVVAAERWQEFVTVHPGAKPEHALSTPAEYRRDELAPDTALLELVRAWLQASGPVSARALACRLAVGAADVSLALGLLEAEGVVLRGQFTDNLEEQWCERRLLARIHRYSIRRTRAAVRPVSRTAFMRFLLDWQHLSPDRRVGGPEGLARVLERLQGVEVPAASWESEVLPARMLDFDPAWLDHLCLSGRAAWLRICPEPVADARRTQRPLSSTPIALCSRANMALFARPSTATPAGALARQVLERLERDGACFADELGADLGCDAPAVEQALVALCALGQVTCDGFAGLRALIRRRLGARRGSRWRLPSFSLAESGRWSRVRIAPGPADPQQARLRELERADRIARVLLARYGVLFKRLIERESVAAPWRDLLRCLRRMEARGEARGGRFVDGFTGEQFALPEAAEMLAARRTHSAGESWVCIAASDPANLTGTLTLGERVPARRGNRVLLRDGVPVAARMGREMRVLEDLDPAQQWQARVALFGPAPGTPAATHPPLFAKAAV